MRKKRWRSHMLVSLYMLLTAGQAHAVFVTTEAGLTTNTSLTFEEIDVPHNPAELVDVNFGLLTDEYNSYGVTFVPGVYYGAEATPGPNITNHHLQSITASVDPSTNPLEIQFTSTQSEVGFNLVAFNVDPSVANTTFSAYLGGSVVETAMAIAGTNSNNFYGFSDIAFDRIVFEVGTGGVSTGVPVFCLDNLTFDVVEPPSIALIGIGFAFLSFLRKRRVSYFLRVGLTNRA